MSDEPFKPGDIYYSKIKVTQTGVFGNDIRLIDTEHEDFKLRKKEISDKYPFIFDFWDDNQIQELRYVSTNMGISRTYIKQYK